MSHWVRVREERDSLGAMVLWERRGGPRGSARHWIDIEIEEAVRQEAIRDWVEAARGYLDALDDYRDSVHPNTKGLAVDAAEDRLRALLPVKEGDE